MTLRFARLEDIPAHLRPQLAQASTATSVSMPQAIPKGPKYHNRKAYRDGIRFDSQGEAAFYDYLEGERRAGRALRVLRQVPFHLPGGVICRMDFVVHWDDLSLAAYDFKGVITDDALNKLKQVRALHNLDPIIVRRKRGQFLQHTLAELGHRVSP